MHAELFKCLKSYNKSAEAETGGEDKIRKMSANVHGQESDGTPVTGISLSLSCREDNN